MHFPFTAEASFLPGQGMQVGYGEGALARVPGAAHHRKTRLLVATLRYPRSPFQRVVRKSGQEVWANLLEQAWRHFGGSWRYLVRDKPKGGLVEPGRYEPGLKPAYAAALAHCGAVADPARVRHPSRKRTAESRGSISPMMSRVCGPPEYADACSVDFSLRSALRCYLDGKVAPSCQLAT